MNNTQHPVFLLAGTHLCTNLNYAHDIFVVVSGKIFFIFKNKTFSLCVTGGLVCLLLVMTAVMIVPAAPAGTPLATLRAQFVEAQSVPPHAGILRHEVRQPVYETVSYPAGETCYYDEFGGYSCTPYPAGTRIVEDCYTSGGGEAGDFTTCTPRILDAGGDYYYCDSGYYLSMYYHWIVNDASAQWWQCNSI